MKKLLIILTLIIAIIIGYYLINNTSTQDLNFNYKGTIIKLGDSFNGESIKENYEYSEIESCAFDGLDKTYKYENFQITTIEKNNKDIIYSIYFLTSNIATSEGLSIGDNVSKIKELYKNYIIEDNIYTISSKDTDLNISISNNTVINIEYIKNNI